MADAAPASVAFGGLDAPSTILNSLLGAFSRYIDNGGEKVVQTVASVAGALLAFQLLKFILDTGFRPSSVSKGVLAFATASAWYTLAINAVPATDAFLKFMGSFGSFMSAGYVDGNVMNNPDTIMLMGLKTSGQMIEAARQLTFLTEAAVVIATVAVALVLIPTFLLLGAACVFAVIRAKLNIVIGLALLPFAIERELRGVAERGLGMILDAGVNLAAMSMVICIGYGFMKEILLSPTPTLRDGICLILASLTIAVMAFFALVRATFSLKR